MLASGKIKNIRYNPQATIQGVLLQYTYNSGEMIKDIHRGMPVIVGLKDAGAKTGHAYVVHAVTYHGTPGTALASNLSLRSIEAVDPWDGKAVTISAGDFQQRVGFMISQQRARQILQTHQSAFAFK